ncbi:hypothetical protein [Lentzea albidocapillata]|uniref:hypothetical protein n=1 Tax=Lentzea albidocapillata TaxID=40571 RepID=UPI003B845A99
MDAHWVHGRAGYRCRHSYTSAKRRPDTAPRNSYVREDHLLDALPSLLGLPAEWRRRTTSRSWLIGLVTKDCRSNTGINEWSCGPPRGLQIPWKLSVDRFSRRLRWIGWVR